MLRYLLVGVLCIAPLTYAAPSDAAEITLNARTNCDTVTLLDGKKFSYCYFSGIVDFSNEDHSLVQVVCYVAGDFAGSQSGGFSELGDGDYGYAQCCNQNGRIQGSGVFQTQDVAYGSHAPFTPAASGYANWTP